MKVAVIGGGAAGFFFAINAAEQNPNIRITIYEKTTKLLQKVKVSGGGRCNVTHHCFTSYKLAENYPRGQKVLKEIFKQFQAKDVVDWFEKRGVQLKTEEDGRMFPVSDTSQTIVDCFLKEAQKLNIDIKISSHIKAIHKSEKCFLLYFSDGIVVEADRVVVATGGQMNIESYSFLSELGLNLIAPIPSLFTFNDSSKKFVALSGVSVQEATVKIAGTKFEETAPLLITHWGLSGPAVIRLSAWAAEYLHQKQYNFTVLVNWAALKSENEVVGLLQAYKKMHPQKKIVSNPVLGLPTRLWQQICDVSEIQSDKKWIDISLHQLNKLVENLYRCPFDIRGKTTFKEEFVTCGGVDLAEIDVTTMESKKVQGLYFAGEVLNIDGITGGFNFQAAWSTAWLAASAMKNQG